MRPMRVMNAPSFAKRVAIAAPIPRDPPVMRTRLPERVLAFRIWGGEMGLGMKERANIVGDCDVVCDL